MANTMNSRSSREKETGSADTTADKFVSDGKHKNMTATGMNSNTDNTPTYTPNNVHKSVPDNVPKRVPDNTPVYDPVLSVPRRRITGYTIILYLLPFLLLSAVVHAAFFYSLKDQFLEAFFSNNEEEDPSDDLTPFIPPVRDLKVVAEYAESSSGDAFRQNGYEFQKPSGAAEEMERDENPLEDSPMPESTSFKHDTQLTSVPNLQDEFVSTPVDVTSSSQTQPPELQSPLPAKMAKLKNLPAKIMPVKELEAIVPERSSTIDNSVMGNLASVSNTMVPDTRDVQLPLNPRDVIRPVNHQPNGIREDLSWTSTTLNQSARVSVDNIDRPVALARPSRIGRSLDLSESITISENLSISANPLSGTTTSPIDSGNSNYPVSVANETISADELASLAPHRAALPLQPRQGIISSDTTPAEMDYPGLISAAGLSPETSGNSDEILSYYLPPTSRGRITPNPTQDYLQRNPAIRVSQISQRGGSPETSYSIESGLKFLASTQWPDGRWTLHTCPPGFMLSLGEGQSVQNGSIECDTAATALGLLAFLGAGYNHLEGQYADVVERGLQYLISHQQKTATVLPDGKVGFPGALYNIKTDTDYNSLSYAHALASIVLCEAYGMTRDERLLPATDLAIGYIVATQNRKLGGWRYEKEGLLGVQHQESDTSATGWMVMALRSAESAGVMDTRQSLHMCANLWLRQAYDKNTGLFRYNPYNTSSNDSTRDLQMEEWAIPSPAMTAEAAFIMFCSYQNKEYMNNCILHISGNQPQEYGSTRPARDVYYWYYATAVMFAKGGAHWKTWQQSIMPLIRKSQINNGTALSGSWDPSYPVEDKWSHIGGRHYLTCMSLMVLEIYSRHLPMYQKLSLPASEVR